MVKSKKNYVLILTSGGIDSTACIRFYKKLKFNVEGLFVDYGQAAGKNEYKSIKSIGKYYNIKVKRIVIKNNPNFKDGLVPGRNAFLFFTALMNFQKLNGIIASGVHYGTGYYDCSQDFIDGVQSIIDKYSQGTIKIGTPFITFNKKEILDYCKIEKVPVDITYSCELGTKKNCGICATCVSPPFIIRLKNRNYSFLNIA